MKLTTNSILIFFGIIALAIMACFPVTLIAMPLLQPAKPNTVDSMATIQAIVTDGFLRTSELDRPGLGA